MERKLLSLPSFFVLLLIAGIAFLATPVVDVHAGVPTATISRTSPTGTGEAPAGNAVYTIDFSEAVRETGSGTGQVASWLGFGPEDLIVIIQQDAAPEGDGGSDTLGSGEYTLAKVANSEDWTVTVAVPTNSRGDISVTLKGADTSTTTAAGTLNTEASFTAVATGNDHYATTTTVVATAGYNTYDGDAPTVDITAGVGATSTGSGATYAISATGGAIFQLEFVFSEPLGTGDAAFAQADISIAILPATAAPTVPTSVIKAVGPKPGAAAATPTFIVAIDPPDDATQVTVGVKKDAVADANGNKLDPAFTRPITINTRPKVMITGVFATSVGTPPSNTLPAEIPLTETREITVTFKLSAVPTATTGNDAFLEADIAVTNGSLKAGSLSRNLLILPTDTVAATYTATVTLPAAADRKTPLEVTVAEDSFKVGALGNLVAEPLLSVPVAVPAPTGPATPPPEDTGVGTALPDPKKGFTFPLSAITPSSSRFVVIAKDKIGANNGISGATVIDIKDSAWEDLRDFLAYDGGTINLTGPAGTTAEDLVISEVMWGSDHGLNDPAMSQWIELYNTKTTRGTGVTGTIPAGTWTIEFLAGAASAVAVSDRFSNRKLGEAHWNIPDTSGGAYGQSGRTKTTATNPGTLRELVSMRRKIDYVKVEKNDHKAAGTANDAANRTEQLKGIPDGALAGSWEASTSRKNMSGTRKGTPGAQPIAIIATTVVNRNGIVFNEIGNRTGSTNDWIELYNRGSAEVKINNYELSKVGDDGKDVKLFKFESNQDVTIPAKGYLLVLNTDPSRTNIAESADVNDSDGSEKGNRGGSSVRYYQNSGLNIPDDKFMLVLRTEPKLGSHEKIADIAGNQFVDNTASATEVWPLRATRKPTHADALNDLKKDDGKSWVRDFGKALFHHEEWKTSDVKGPGYKRNADSLNSGTPGYPNNAVQNEVKSDGLTHRTPVVISEIMFGKNTRVPQWIELYNPSTTQTVNLEKWTLEIQNIKSAEEDLRTETNATLTLNKILVHPNQTVLIVSTHGSTSKNEHFPSSRLINLWDDHKEDLDMSSRRDAVLSSIGFYLALSDPKKRVVDEVGNLDGNKRTNDDPAWALPGGNLVDGDGRASMIRREGSFGDGTVADAWISAAVVDGLQRVGIDELYFGSEDDIGTPGYRAGGPLPVQLSSFYSKRNDAGAVIITWSTESELDNAGFNLLRSSSRSGEFTKINAQLIPGAGTTGEKNTYTWTDTGAHPNVVYYYQIEDVSLDGAHRTLRTTRLRGHVGAHGKLTTTWGVLKSRD